MNHETAFSLRLDLRRRLRELAERRGNATIEVSQVEAMELLRHWVELEDAAESRLRADLGIEKEAA